ncbi:alpha/beta hydrolase [Bacillus sp. ISL-75]|uniref:lipase family alpha/beta hydrolase n=1 Tax=Bacillus sp. ISL-75 TaxID=2819137 RepID=UPI001BE6FA2D|nr:alpha/beta hydrolase [Bacillus sp. ISL-75]MBT2727817.1 alpha/beta hydrolase [Bacillus sp. ISL-75]
MIEKRIGVIIIHGTMGSVLKKEGKKIWPLHYGSQEHYIQSLTPITNSVEPSHMLSTYQPLKAVLKLKFDIVEEFVYDWRLNNLEHSNLLKSKIASMNVDEVHIVAHSMGGIIAKICLIEHEGDPELEKVKKLITLGTPWKGSMDAVKTLLYGSQVPDKYLKFIDKKASKEISLHFPSVYQLLPNEEFLNKLKSMNCVPFFLNDSYYDKFDDFFQGVLQEKFVENHSYEGVFSEYYELLKKEVPSHIELHEVIGTGKPTIKIICENSRKEPYVSYDEGDGTVPLLSAYSDLHDRQNYYPYFVNKASHVGMTFNPDIINLVMDIILENDFTPNFAVFNDLESEMYRKFSGYISKVACPVDISIRDNEGNIIYGNIESIFDEEIRALIQKDYQVENIGSTTYVIFDETNDTNIKNFDGLVIDAYDKGLTSIRLDKYEDGKITKRQAFKTFEINPNLQAELVLKEETNTSSLVITKNGEIEQTLQLHDISIDEDKVKTPSTFINFSGDNIIHLENENIFIGTDKIILQIDKVVPGDFEPKQTFILINGKEYTVKNNIFYLDLLLLNHGENVIEFFTIDEYDYSEAKQKIILYYFHKITSKVEFLFNDKLYLVNLSEDPTYSRIANLYNLERTPPMYSFQNNEGVTGYQVIYSGIEREMEIHYTDIFGKQSSYNFLVDELIAKKIVKGAATVSDVQTFVKKLNLTSVNYQFHLNKSGNHKLLNDNNLNGSTKFEIFSDTSNVEIVKNVELDVSFESLSEHINVTSEIEYYTFIFKVLDVDQQYVKDLNLVGEIIFSINPDKGIEGKLYKEKFDVEYMTSNGSYKLILNLKGIKNILDGYWKPQEKVLSTAKLYIINTKNNANIRGLDLKIAK